ncbi:hypothetical protein [Angustibacter aerolatus]
MTEVSVPLDWLQQGRCGPLCARHGVVTTHATKRTLLSPTPAWMYLLLLAGVVVFVVVVAATRRRETGRLPACERCRTERRTWVGGVLAAWALVVITFVVAVQRSSAGLATVAVVLAVLALLATAGGDLLRVRTELSPDAVRPVWVRLRGVHPAFADGVRSALGPAVGFGGQQVLGANVLPGGRV